MYTCTREKSTRSDNCPDSNKLCHPTPSGGHTQDYRKQQTYDSSRSG